jgi:serine/threonine-protein kinase
MSEEILNKLSQLSDLKVIARTSSFAFKGKNEDMREIGKKLDVAHLLEGSVRKIGNQLRITAQLIKVSDGSHLWSQSYDQEIKDASSIFDIQDEISLAIVDNLKINLFGKEKIAILKQQTTNLEAYNLRLKGAYYLNKMTPEGFELAVEYFSQSLKQDSNFASAYVGLAYVLFFSTYYGNISPNKAYPKAKEYVNQALAIDNNLAEAHTAMGNINMNYDLNWKSAENELKLALQMNPNSNVTHGNYSAYLTLTEQHDEAIDEAERWLQLDPLSEFANAMLAQAYRFAQQYDKALEECKKTLSMHPDYFLAHQILGDIYSDKSMVNEASKEYKQAYELSGGYAYAAIGLAKCYFELGQNEKAEELMKNLEMRSRYEYVPPTTFLLYHLYHGDMDKAYEWLKRAIDEKDSFLVWLRISSGYRSQISDEPRLISLMKKLN